MCQRVQPLAKQRNHAVARQSQSNCKSMKHELNS
jgi:hypothetical protein